MTNAAPRRGRAWPILVSAALHVALVPIVSLVAYRSLRKPEPAGPAPSETMLELPVFAAEGTGPSGEAVTTPESATPKAFGGETVARADTGRAGKGGESFGARAVNLAASDDGFVSGTSIPSHRERDQEQRLRTARVRQTRDDRRATTHPMELTFLASGRGSLPERRTPARSDPSRGVLRSTLAAVTGGALGASAEDAPAPDDARAGASREGADHDSPGVGLRKGHAGEDHRSSASVTLARPLVDEAAPTIPAVSRGRPHDTVDSDQAVAEAVRGIVHASVTGGLPGAGEGGSAGAAAPGASGPVRGGSTARPLGAGDGDVFDWYAADPMLAPYLRRLHAKVDPLLADAFPRSALLELKQGRVILEVVIAKDGRATVQWPPARPSGIPQFDRNCAEAFKRAAPFDPLPAYLGDGPLRLRAPIEAKNPIVK